MVVFASICLFRSIRIQRILQHRVYILCRTARALLPARALLGSAVRSNSAALILNMDMDRYLCAYEEYLAGGIKMLFVCLCLCRYAFLTCGAAVFLIQMVRKGDADQN